MSTRTVVSLLTNLVLIPLAFVAFGLAGSSTPTGAVDHTPPQYHQTLAKKIGCEAPAKGEIPTKAIVHKHNKDLAVVVDSHLALEQKFGNKREYFDTVLLFCK